MIVKNVEKKENSTATILVEVEADAFEVAVSTAYKRMKGSIYVAGFRKGKAPRTVIEGMYGRDVFYEEAVTAIAPDAFEFAIEDTKLDNVGMPGIVDFDVDENRVLSITFMTELYPEVTLGQFKDLEAEYAEPAVSDEDIATELEAARKRNARHVDVDRAVQMGDTVILDFEGFVDGESFSGGKAEEYNLEIGSGSFIPGFEEGLVGMERDVDGEVSVVFPEQYDEKLAGKDAIFKVKIHTIREAQLPELDDEFAKDVSEFDTLDEYTADMRANMLKNLSDEAENNYKGALMNQAIDNMTAIIPEGMVDEKVDEFLRNYADSMGMRGNITREDLIKTLGLTEEVFVQMMRPTAERQVQADMLLDKIIEDEKIEVTDEEKADFYKKLEDDYGPEADKVKEMVDENLMIRDLSRKKAADMIYSSGIKVAPKAEVAEEAENQD